MEDKLRVGVISSTHGIRGEVKVFPTTDSPNRFKKMKKVILNHGKEELELEIEGVKFFKQFAILKFKGIDHINDIEAYKGGELYVARENAQKLGKDEYFIADLLGVSVVDENGEKLGVLKDVIETGANDVYVVERENKKDLLIPAIKQCIRKVDVEAGEMEELEDVLSYAQKLKTVLAPPFRLQRCTVKCVRRKKIGLWKNLRCIISTCSFPRL